MANEPETPYTETEALLAVMGDDQDGALELLAGMLPGELYGFRNQVHILNNLIATVRAVHRGCRFGFLDCGKPAIGYYVISCDRPRGICTDHTESARELGYTVHPLTVTRSV